MLAWDRALNAKEFRDRIDIAVRKGIIPQHINRQSATAYRERLAADFEHKIRIVAVVDRFGFFLFAPLRLVRFGGIAHESAPLGEDYGGNGAGCSVLVYIETARCTKRADAATAPMMQPQARMKRRPTLRR